METLRKEKHYAQMDPARFGCVCLCLCGCRDNKNNKLLFSGSLLPVSLVWFLRVCVCVWCLQLLNVTILMFETFFEKKGK